MDIINIHKVKTHLSRLVEGAARGHPFVIAKAGRPVAIVSAMESTREASKRRIGFLEGELSIPDDFDRMGEAEIARQFGIAEDDPAS